MTRGPAPDPWEGVLCAALVIALAVIVLAALELGQTWKCDRLRAEHSSHYAAAGCRP